MKAYILLPLALTISASIMAQPATPAKPTNVAILLYPGVELLDFSGPLEVFSLMPNAHVYTVAAKPGLLITMNNTLTLTPDYTIEQAPQPHILVVPGAADNYIRSVVSDTAVLDWIRRTTSGRQVTMSVCTGAFVLGKVGLLNHKTVTTHWASTEMLQRMTPQARVMEHTRFVEDGKLLTTAGVSAGIDGALRVVERLRGREAARDVARVMEYDYWNTKPGLIISKTSQKFTRRKPVNRLTIAVNRTAPVRTILKQKGPVTLASTIDPVCKMDVSAEHADTTRYMGKVYGFCSKICKERFSRHPVSYLP